MSFRMPIQRTWTRDGRNMDPTLDGPFVWTPSPEDRRWADQNHGQTLERLKERGGMSWCEMVAIVGNRRWAAMDQHEAKAECLRLHPPVKTGED